jgi:uncharacterized protein Veg
MEKPDNNRKHRLIEVDDKGLFFGHIFMIEKDKDTVTFTECCDYYYEDSLTKEHAIEMLTYMIEWINS